jgi:hypothetical protein
LAKSIVTVTVNVPGEKPIFCTGFVWEKPDQVVTSLHAMREGGKITVKYQNNAKYLFVADHIKVYKEADLVLLKITRSAIPLPTEVVPLTMDDINFQRLEPDELIYTIGYPGAILASNLVLTKGWVQGGKPETLAGFLAEIYVNRLRQHGFPSVNLDIVFVRGSLMPGYSGSPCVDSYGKLVGIGDGGLEDGALDRSWLIPAKFLKTLENSTNNTLPATMASKMHFCTALVNDDSSFPDSVASKDFEFWLKKNRSLQEMYETSANDENLIKILTQFQVMYDIKVNANNLRFDIYEDIKQGVVIAVPEGERLYYHPEANLFQVNRRDDSQVNFLFQGKTGDFSNYDIDTELIKTFRWLKDSMEVFWNVKEFTTDNNFNDVVPLYDNPATNYEENMSFANLLLTSESVLDSAMGGYCTVYLYVNLIQAQNREFLSVASYKILDEKFNEAKLNGVDCFEHGGKDEDCLYFSKFIQAFCAVHLTTFAY